MVRPGGLELSKELNFSPQKQDDNTPEAQIEASSKNSSSELSPDEADEPPLRELCKLWPKLSPDVKRLLLLMAREGGKAK